MPADDLVLGLDCGLTVTKAVVFDRAGTPLGTGSSPSPHATPQPHWVERDLDELWHTCIRAVRDAVAASGRPAAGIAAISVTAHGDGLYCVDEHGRATRPGISSLDTRAHEIARRWEEDGTAAASLPLTGQHPAPSSPVTLLRWLAEHEPEVLARARWVLPCKDAVRMRLTGRAATDPTEASESFTDVATQDYDSRVLAQFDLAAYADRLPPIVGCTEPAGALTTAAAEELGLPAGVPVVTGCHDVDASALGSGCVHPGQLAVIAGSYSINEVIASAPATDARWFARTFAVPGRWLHMGISPASATNLEWFMRELCPDLTAAPGGSTRLYETLAAAYQEVADDPSHVVFLPYLYGTPAGVDADAAFVGVRGWHRRAHLLRAVLEGVVFNHRQHVDALRERFPVESVRLTGGASRAPHWAQLFADAFDLPVEVVHTEETGALGAALCALVGIGAFPDLDRAVESVGTDHQARGQHEAVELTPRPASVRSLEAAYRRFLPISAALGERALARAATDGADTRD